MPKGNAFRSSFWSHALAGRVVLGNVYFVDSGASNASNGNDGLSPDTPTATIDGAINKCTASNGDYILVAPGHAESVSAAADIDLDIAGVTLLGVGNGRNRPVVTFDTVATADVDIDAANITIENIVWDVTGVDAVTAAVDVNAVTDFTFKNNEVIMADGCGQAVEFILTVAGCDRMKVLDNLITAPNAGAANAISLVGISNGVEIKGNRILGDFTDAAIHNPTGGVLTDLLIEDN